MRNLKFILGFLFVSVLAGAAANNFPDLRVIPKSTGSRPAGVEGQLYPNSSTHYLQYKDNSGWGDVCTADNTLTFTHKSFDVDGTGNSLTNIANANVKSAAAIALNKLAATTASRALVSDGSGFASPATTTSTEIGYVNGVTSAIQTQLDAKTLKSTLSAKGSIYAASAASTPADLAVGADGKFLKAASGQATGLQWANLAVSDLTALTASRACVTDGSGLLSAATTTSTEIGYVNGVTSAIQTQLDARVFKSTLGAKGSIVSASAASSPVEVTVGSNDQVLTADSAQSSGLKWASAASLAGAPTSSEEITNVGLAASVSANALTIALKQADGSADCASGTGACKIGFRSSTAATGLYNQRSVTGSLSLVISSGSTLGHTSATNSYIYIYALDNAGTVELAASSLLYDDGTVQTSTAEGGAGGADSLNVIYSTNARSGVPFRLIGRMKSNQTTAGTWAVVPTEIALRPFLTSFRMLSVSPLKAEVGLFSCNSSSGAAALTTPWISSIGNISSGSCTVTLKTGVFSTNPYCIGSSDTTSLFIIGIHTGNSTSITLTCKKDDGTNCTTFDVYAICFGQG